MYRQGDVLIKPVTKMPAAVKKVDRDAGRVVLAYGEVTGHAHAISDERCDLFAGDKLEARFLEVLAEGGVELLHEEHSTITLPPGIYEVTRQREYGPDAIRNVAD